MQVGDQVRIISGSHAGMTGTIVNTRDVMVSRRGQGREYAPLRTAIITIKTKIDRFFKETENNVVVV